MKPKTIVYLIDKEPIKTGEDMETVLARLDRLQPNGTLMLNRLTDHGSVKRCFIPAPTVVRIEDA